MGLSCGTDLRGTGKATRNTATQTKKPPVAPHRAYPQPTANTHLLVHTCVGCTTHCSGWRPTSA